MCALRVAAAFEPARPVALACVALLSDAAAVTPLTIAGVRASEVVALPSCPMLFWPQQYTEPSDVTAQVCFLPALIRTTPAPRRPLTVTGVPLHAQWHGLSGSVAVGLAPQRS